VCVALGQVTTASDMFVPYDNCFELFGFDVMIDEDMQPWLLEVRVCVRVCARVCARARVCVCVCAACECLHRVAAGA